MDYRLDTMLKLRILLVFILAAIIEAHAGAALLLFALSKTRRREMLGAGAILLLGVSLEVAQHLIYRNHLEWRDIGDDAVAILAAFALYRLTGAWKPRPEARP